jgi:hypothetical protein
MKKIFLVFPFCFLLVLNLFSQEKVATDKVPAVIRQAVAKRFPAAKNIQYEKQDQEYRAGFLENGKQCYVYYDPAGKWLETEKAIDPSALPKEVAASAAKNFKGYTIVDAARREASDKGTCYEADLMKDQAGFQVRFSEKGDVLVKVPRKVEFKVVTK